MRATSKHSMVLGIAAALIAASACGSDTRSSTPDDSPSPPTTAIVSTAAVEVPGNTSTYNSKAFNMPFDITVPAWLATEPDDEQPNFVTWKAADADRAVRFLIPVNVYPPGGTGTMPLPKDYLAYLLSQADHGAHFADTTETTVGGRPATIVTATVDNSLDGSLGCPAEGMAADDCFGLQPDLVLRLAVVDSGDGPLLVWLRNNNSATDNQTNEVESFETMLASIQFSDRAVQAPLPTTTVAAPLPVATALDGTYQWTITKDDALAHGTPGDKTPEGLAGFPAAFTVTMTEGTWAMGLSAAGVVDDEGGGSYTVVGDQVIFNWDNDVLTFTFAVDADGTMHLTPAPSMTPGDQFIWATEPWEKVG
jgi:hypothetical protein